MHLIKLLLQILWQGSETAALMLLKLLTWAQIVRVAHEILLNRSVTHTRLHTLSPSTSPCKGYIQIYIHSGMGSQLCLHIERPYVQDTEKVKSFVPWTSSHPFTDSTS